MEIQPSVSEPLAGCDLLWGRDAIAAYIGKSTRQTQYLLETRQLPAGKQGRQWVSSRAVLDRHFAKLIAA